jgi:single-strand DNA-binding protein
MASYNKVLLMGNLTRDPEMRYTPGGMALARLGLAVNRVFTDKNNQKREEVTFIDIDVWGRQAEIAQQYLSKGRPVFVEGRLKLDQWDDKQTGQKRSKLLVVADRIQFLGSGGGGQGGGQGGGERGAQQGNAPARGQGRPQGRSAQPAPANADSMDSGPDQPPEDLDIPEENIPF